MNATAWPFCGCSSCLGLFRLTIAERCLLISCSNLELTVSRDIAILSLLRVHKLLCYRDFGCVWDDATNVCHNAAGLLAVTSYACTLAGANYRDPDKSCLRVQHRIKREQKSNQVCRKAFGRVMGVGAIWVFTAESLCIPGRHTVLPAYGKAKTYPNLYA